MGQVFTGLAHFLLAHAPRVGGVRQPGDFMRDYYALLGVAPDASADVIKAAYRKKAAQYHPDRNPSADAAARFREVQEAYEVLSDTVRRTDYDDNRRRSLLADPLVTARGIFGDFLERVLRDAKV
jgi:curved DNA-binding protein CbpA